MFRKVGIISPREGNKIQKLFETLAPKWKAEIALQKERIVWRKPSHFVCLWLQPSTPGGYIKLQHYDQLPRAPYAAGCSILPKISTYPGSTYPRPSISCLWRRSFHSSILGYLGYVDPGSTWNFLSIQPFGRWWFSPESSIPSWPHRHLAIHKSYPIVRCGPGKEQTSQKHLLLRKIETYQHLGWKGN